MQAMTVCASGEEQNIVEVLCSLVDLKHRVQILIENNDCQSMMNDLLQ